MPNWAWFLIGFGFATIHSLSVVKFRKSRMKLDLRKGLEYNDAEEVVAMGLAGFRPQGEQAGYDFDEAFDEAYELLYPMESIGEAQDELLDQYPEAK